jgi:hypothetical protein
VGTIFFKKVVSWSNTLEEAEQIEYKRKQLNAENWYNKLTEEQKEFVGILSISAQA